MILVLVLVSLALPFFSSGSRFFFFFSATDVSSFFNFDYRFLVCRLRARLSFLARRREQSADKQAVQKKLGLKAGVR